MSSQQIALHLDHLLIRQAQGTNDLIQRLHCGSRHLQLVQLQDWHDPHHLKWLRSEDIDIQLTEVFIMDGRRRCQRWYSTIWYSTIRKRSIFG